MRDWIWTREAPPGSYWAGWCSHCSGFVGSDERIHLLAVWWNRVTLDRFFETYHPRNHHGDPDAPYYWLTIPVTKS